VIRRPVIRARADDVVLWVLVAAFPVLLWRFPGPLGELPALVDWKTMGALAGLMVLSRSMEDSGYLRLAGRHLLARVGTERWLAAFLVVFAAALSAVITNDVALFIVVPLTLGLRGVAELPLGRLVVFQALAVNAGSAGSPIGNPQNLFLWQSSGVSFQGFVVVMAPLALALTGMVLLLIPLAFRARRIPLEPSAAPLALRRDLLAVALLLYPVFLVLVDRGLAVPAAVGILLLFLLRHRGVLAGVDWVLLLVFLLMFLDLGMLARLPGVAALGPGVEGLPGGFLTGGILVSQVISNVPAAIFLQAFAPGWEALAWGVSVGGFGLAIGSLANLIALRLCREPGIWRDFHRWSVPALVLGWGVAWVLGGWFLPRMP
jgi:Na+/H+ antiporter NhaD/arsenite permease-like protein